MKPTLKRYAQAVSMAAIAGAMAISADPAHALNVTVGGTTYDIKFYTGSFNSINSSYSNVLTSATTAPWWGDSAKAVSFRDAYASAASSPYAFDKNTAMDILNFGYSEFMDTIQGHGFFDTGGKSSMGTFYSDTGATAGTTTIHYAYVDTGGGSTAAPEIDANALTKALFLLFAFGVWQVATRSRQDIA